MTEIDALQPAADMRATELEEGVVGVRLFADIGDAAGSLSAGSDRGAVEAAIADLGHQNRKIMFHRQTVQEIDRRFVVECRDIMGLNGTSLQACTSSCTVGVMLDVNGG